MKVLLLSHRFAPLSIGGVERWTWTLAEALGELGHDVAVLSRDDRNGSPLPPFSLVEGAPAGMPSAGGPRGAATWWITHRHRDARVASEAWNDHRFDRPLDAVLNRVQPDVVHVAHVDGWGVIPFRRAGGAVLGATLHDYKAVCARGQLVPDVGPACVGVYEERCVRCVPGQLKRGPARALVGAVFGGLASAPKRDRTRIEDRCDPGQEARRRWRSRRRALLSALEGCDVLTAPSAFCAQVHREAGLERRIDVVRNGVDGERARTPRSPGPLRVGFFGTDVPTKGLDLLLRACPRSVELHVHGPTPRADRPGVTWHGRYPPDEALARMAGVDLVAMPSRWPENAPLVAAEARLAGKPLLVADVGGLPEVADADWVLPADDLGAWTARLEQLGRAVGAIEGETMGLPPSVRDVGAALLALWTAAMR